MEQVPRGKDLKTAAYERLRDLIERDQLAPGTFWGAGELSARLAVSRTPVREALLQLQEEGFVEIVPFRGARVPHLTADHIRSVYEMRAALEGYAAWRAAHDLRDDEIETLKQLAELQARNRDSEDASWLEATEGLHQFLVQRLNNDLLAKQAAQLVIHHSRIRRLAAGLRHRRDVAIAEHQTVTAAILLRDPVGAYDAMTEHLMSVAADVIRAKLRAEVSLRG
ncbi:MAG: GntR family transcriptional regulator [Chloroflexi bacterium]|nr:GntR family transcriptional regulator [Chloroflexota bacterium]